MSEEQRWGLRLSANFLNNCVKQEVVFNRSEANLSGAAFERAVINKYTNLRSIPRPVAPQLQSFFARGTRRAVEPIVDCYAATTAGPVLVEIKKGFYVRNQNIYLASSTEQLEVLRRGTTRVGGNGTRYLPGEYWVFVRRRMSSTNTRNVKFWRYRITAPLVEYLFTYQDRLGTRLS